MKNPLFNTSFFFHPFAGKMLAAILVFFFTVESTAQDFNLGTPPIINYPKKNYRAGTQNWDIAQAQNGVMYFANNDGLLEFDGTYWRLLPLSNGTIVRSVAVAGDGKIFVGGQGELGYFFPDGAGKLTYVSIKNLVPEAHRNFEDVWDILLRPEGVFFRTNHQIFRLKDGKMEVLLSGQPLVFMGIFHKNILVQDSGHNILVFQNGNFVTLGTPLGQVDITAILPLTADTLLFTTIKNGIFYYAGQIFGKWQTAADALFEADRIYCAAMLPGGKVALGTSLDGLLILDRQRRILQHLNKGADLQNNTVLSIFTDRSHNLWLGLDNGIDFVHVQSPFTAIFPDGKREGTGYAAAIHEGKIYFGTNTGLYFSEWKTYYPPAESRHFKQVKNASGQVWGLNKTGNALLAGLHEGPFSIVDDRAIRLSQMAGFWKFFQLDDHLALAGHYSGLAFFKKTEGEWRFDGDLLGLKESCRILTSDGPGQVWVSHPYRGVYQLSVDTASKSADVAFFNSSNGLPSDLNNYVFNIGGQAVFTTENGIFNFNPQVGHFEPNHYLNQIFGEKKRVKYLQQDDNGNIWFVAGDETGVLWVTDKGLEKTVARMPIPDLAGKLVGGFEFILPVDGNNVFFATDKGFVHFNPALYPDTGMQANIVLHSIRLENDRDSLLFGGHFPTDGNAGTVVLQHDLNALRFDFSSTDFAGGEYVQYAHFLEGLQPGWSKWDSQPSLVFNNLSPGKYTFHLKARNKHGREGEALSWSFEISAPWYLSTWAYTIYALLLAGCVGAVLYSQRRRFEKEKAHLQTSHQEKEAQHQRQAQQSETEIAQLRNEKLRAEVMHKNQELATTTMHLVQKSDLMTTIRLALEKLKSKTEKQHELREEIGRLIKVIEKDASLDEDWEHFSQYFDEVHSDFLKRLGEQFPQLSPNDFKLCAYLRMNLSSKEIASLMNISVRGVEASRYRLRKRLDLATDVNLTDFLMRM